MNNNKKERALTPKGFLFKSRTKAAASAGAFIQAHRAWLETGDLASLTSPILAKLDAKEILPTPALNTIQNVVLGHMIAKDLEKGERAQARMEATAEPKNWQVIIYTAKHEVETRVTENGKIEDLIKEFDLGQEADRWCDRRLAECASDCYGIVRSEKLGIQNTVSRDEALGRLNAPVRGPMTKKKPAPGGGRLGFGVRAKQDHCHFSRG